MRRAVVLRAKHEMRRHCRVQPQSVGLGDLQSRRQIGHLGILPTKHPAIVGHNDVAVVHPHEVVLVGMGSARRGSTLPVKLAIPSLSPVQCAPQVDATHKHVTGIGGIHFQAQIPERLSQIVRAVDGHAKQIGTGGLGGHRLPSGPGVDTSPEGQEVLLDVVAGHSVHRVAVG